jgi:hypothetical protein
MFEVALLCGCLAIALPVRAPDAPVPARLTLLLKSQEASAEARSGNPQHRESQGCSTVEEREAKQCASVGGSHAQVADPAGDSQAALVVTPCTSESAAPRNESTQVLPPVSQLCGGAACWDPVDEERQRLAVVARLATTPPGDRFAPITA